MDKKEAKDIILLLLENEIIEQQAVLQMAKLPNFKIKARHQLQKLHQVKALFIDKWG